MAIDLEGQLEIRSSEGTTVRIAGSGPSLEISITGHASGVIANLGRARLALPIVRIVAVALERAGLSATVRLGERRILAIGRNVVADGPARVLRIPHARLRS